MIAALKICAGKVSISILEQNIIYFLKNKRKQNIFYNKQWHLSLLHKLILRGDNCMLLAHRPLCTVTLNSN